LPRAELDVGTVLLEASAGTGKTYTIVGILLRLLLEERIERLDQALVVTFTVAAAAELKNRLRRGLEAVAQGGGDDPFLRELAARPGAAERTAQALDDFDQVPIATIHGFCKRLLDEAAFESRTPFELEFLVDPVPLLDQAAADALRSCYTEAPSALPAVLHRAGLEPTTLVKAYQLWHRYPDVALAPLPADATPHLAALAAALPRAVAAATPDVLAALQTWSWAAKKSPFPNDGTTLAHLHERLHSAPWTALDFLCRLAPAELERRLNKKNRPAFDHPLVLACGALAEAADHATAHLRVVLLQRMHARLEGAKTEQRALSFDDLVLRTHEALHDQARAPALLQALRQRYRVGLIDEFQDTDARQYGIFRQLFAGRPLFLVGDPKQAIYGFRGGDLRAYLRARSDAALHFTLGTSYRSGPDLVAAVQRVFAGPRPFANDALDLPAVQAAARNQHRAVRGDGGAALQFRVLTDKLSADALRARIAQDVTAEIAMLLRGPARLDDRALRPKDLAVLTRTNREAVLVQENLREAGIAAAIGKAGDVFDTDEIAELDLFLKSLLQPRDLRLARAAMATRWWGLDAAALAALEGDETALERELGRLDRFRQAWLRHGLVVMVEAALRELGTRTRLLAQPGGERRLTNFRQLVELLHAAEHQGRLAPEGLYEWLQRERIHRDELDYQLRELRLESDEQAVQILTVHGSKGLEYEVVFCPFLWAGRNPTAPTVLTEGDHRVLVHELDAQQKLDSDAERLEEDLRLCYVGLTRAKRRCVVHWTPNASGHERSALGWLLTVDRPADRSDHDELTAFHKELKSRLAQANRLAELAAEPRVVQVFEVPGTPTLPLAEAPAAAPALVPPRRPARTVRAQGLYSFSSLCAGADPIDTARDLAEAPDAAAASDAATGIFAFARGTAAGQCLHAILERTNLADLATAPDLVREQLRAHGLAEPGNHAAPIAPESTVLALLHDLAGARLPASPTLADPPTLAELCRGPHQAEWSFALPAEHADLGDLARRFALSDSRIARAYANRLRQLPARALRGFLVGFVDLIAEHGGRYWVLDWKSNHLGNQRADYTDRALEQAMHDHDYVLQYHLYVLALHRLLRARQPDYDPEQHLGGVCYPFLRGVAAGSHSGLFFDRVPTALVHELDAWVRGDGRGARR
jgi:exodeoxyribonuclease V beta subunit